MENILTAFFCFQVLCNAKFLVNNQKGFVDPNPKLEDWPCPLAADIDPCACTPIPDVSGVYYAIDMDCSAATTSQDLWVVFNVATFPIKQFRQLTIKQDKATSILTELLLGTFGDIYFEIIKITNTAINVIEGGAFQNSESSVYELTLSNNELNSFPYESLSNYKALLTLDLSNNRIVGIPPLQSNCLNHLNLNHNMGLGPNITSSPGVFSGLTKIQKIDLVGTGIKILPPNIFDTSLSEIKSIDLSNNEIAYLETNAISCQNDNEGGLIHLWFDNNDIEFVQNNAITGMSTTGFLSLRNNKLTQLIEAVWDNVFATAASIDYAGNPLLCGCDVAWIVSNDTLKSKVGPGTCYEGTTFQSLDLAAFSLHC